jgi:hypothetical protein
MYGPAPQRTNLRRDVHAPDAFARYVAWKQANLDRSGPLEDWEVGMGRATDGRDFVAVWVPEQHAPSESN